MHSFYYCQRISICFYYDISIYHVRLPNFPKSSATSVNYWCGKSLPAEWKCINGFQLMRRLSLPRRNFIGRNVSSARTASTTRASSSSSRPGRRRRSRKPSLTVALPPPTLHPEYLKRVADLFWIVKQTKAIPPNQHSSGPREPPSDFCSLSSYPLSYLRLFLTPAGRNRIAKSNFASHDSGHMYCL